MRLGRLLIIVVLALAGGASAESAPTAGRLVFVQYSHPCPCKAQIAVASPNGTGRRALTKRYQDSTPAWSPNGRLIAFVRTTARGYHQLHVIKADGTGDRVLLPDAFGIGGEGGSPPTWSADGKSVLFLEGIFRCSCPLYPFYGVKKTGWALVAVRLKGRPRVRRLFGLPGNVHRRSWFDARVSPNGRWIVLGSLQFTSTDTVQGIWLVHPNGTGLHKLATPNRGDFGAFAWSPDSTRIAYHAYQSSDGSPCGSFDADSGNVVWVAGADGTAPKPLWSWTCGGEEWTGPEILAESGELHTLAWAPDGRHVLYSTLDYTAASTRPNTWGLPLHLVDVGTGEIQPLPIPPIKGCSGGGVSSGPCTLVDADWTAR